MLWSGNASVGQMKISLATFHCAISYGAALQTLALCRFLEEAGHAVEIVDYRPDAIAHPADWRRTRFGGLHPAHLESWAIRRKFATFWARHYALTPRTYRTFAELRADPPAADAYVCGSDQIWNPAITGGTLDPAYFLDFAPAGRRRIAYAASFGGPDLPSDHRGSLRRLLDGFHAVSCREPSGAAFLAAETGRTVPAVVDPTFLWNGYEKLLPAGVPTDIDEYLFAYPLQHDPEFTRAAVAAGEELGLALRTANGPWKFWTQPGRPVYPDPGRWAALVHRSRAVVTHSFHGVAFSILFRKNFVVLPLAGTTATRNARIVELLDRMGLGDRLVPATDLATLRRRLKTSIDWEVVGRLQAQHRDASARFLLDALR